MPSGDYQVTDAIALGQQPELGSLIWRQRLCGQVLNVDCGHGNLEAVVASTCNLGSGSCGVDMIQKTWNKATNNQNPGIASCKVSLSHTNPIKGSGPLCYHRPNSELNNPYSQIIGVLNTGGKISSGANLAGKTGKRNNDGWFEFNGGGQPLFVHDAKMAFYFEDGSSANFQIKDCKSGGQTKIFQ